MAVQPIAIEPAPRGGDAARPRSDAAPTDLFAVLLRGHWQETDAPADRMPEHSAPLADSETRPEAPTAAPTPEPSAADSERKLPDVSAASIAAWLPAATPAPAITDVPPLVSASAHAQAIATASLLPVSAAPPTQATVGVAHPAVPAVPANPAIPVVAPIPAVPAVPALQAAADPRPPTVPSTPEAANSGPPPAVVQTATWALDPTLGNASNRSPVEAVPAAHAARPTVDSPAFGAPAPVVRSATPAPIAGLAAVAPGAPIALAAQQVGEAARAAAPGRTKTAGEPAAPGGNPVARVMTEVTPSAGHPPAPGPASAPDVPPAPETAVADLAAAAAAKADATGLGMTVPPPHGLPGAAPTDQATAAGGRPAFAAPPLPEQLTVHIQKAVHDGADRINIQLRPAELGRIEVRLEFAQDGRLSATVLADRAETLDLLQRDARVLERALQDAGLKADSGSLTFNLRGEGRQDFGQALARRAADRPAIASEASAPDLPESAAPAASRHLGAIDIRV